MEVAADSSRFSYILELLKRDRVAIKGIERELICPACKELFTHPLILPCQHNVCHKCVKEILFAFEDSFADGGSESSNQSSPRIRISASSMDRIDRISRSGRKRNSLTPRSTLFPCPGCQRDIDLGERGINGLFRNFTLETIVERYRQAARAAIAIMCDFCKPPPQESTKSCMDCSASYCNECFKIHHPWGTLKAQHEYVGPTTNFRPKILMCPEHEMERVNMYCEICRRPVCHLCKLGGCHANHRVTTMSTAYKTLKEKLSKDIEYLISKESQVKAHITQLDLLLKETECNSERAKQEASQSFEKLYHVLEEKKSAALRAIETSKNIRLEKLQTQVEEYQGLLENNGLVGYAQEVLKETDPSCFVQTAKQLHVRIQKATESLKTFRPAAETTFEDFVVDIAKQEDILGDLSFHSNGLEIPEINEEQSRMYNQALISWECPGKTDSADIYVLEYHKLNREEENVTWQKTEVCGKSKVVSDLDDDSSYAFRVRGYKGSICSPWSREVILRTPPAPVFSFLFDDKCGYNNEHLQLNPRRTSVESRAGFPLLLGSERLQVGCYTTLDYIIGDTGIAKGKHFWAFRVEAYSYLVKVGVVPSNKIQKLFHSTHDVTSPRYEQDSGHDSGSEDAFFDSSQPCTLVTLGMKKFFIPTTPAALKDPASRILPLPSCLGICLDCDRGRVGFYDAGRMKCLYECEVDCSGIMYPAFALMGGAAVHLEEAATAKYREYNDDI
ncbi:E3 ubiquitin-protein ligase TRIM36 isoform X1 [Pipra filicauda]|uniref:E3 ubiquitin-protein ligase TRIM36 isoform X1 n=3 Tax=Pipridae TaxID=114313 RepID=A0A6J2FSR4_9PASS|nr:E3 ubiquitin-protein ligase TRIM36 isoform X1 [Manacus vitellinus]XP_027566087.1 E3 ubiquitin-protein ligase TRIM36 isoform X1 [Pipra filicauda]XP_051645330.1 E3 ubiquitin-protein ligase TRIM36 isoform X2 [Manacus candei]